LHLTVNEQGIDHFAAVVHRHVFFDFHAAGVGIDFDDADVRTEGKRKIARLEGRVGS
jgi:hypothetical protein